MSVELLAGRRPHHDGDDALAEALVRRSDDRDLVDARMRGQHVLHLERMDVLAARDDHVVDAPVEPQVAVLVEVTRVAGAVPAVPHRLRIRVGPIPVARERLVRPEVHEDLAGVVDPEPRVDRRAVRRTPASTTWSRPIVNV